MPIRLFARRLSAKQLTGKLRLSACHSSACLLKTFACLLKKSACLLVTCLLRNCSIKKEQPRRAGIAYHADGVDLEILRADERRHEKRAANPELPGVDVGCAEVLRVHQQQRGGREKADNGGTKPREHALHGRRVHVFHEDFRYQNHQYERRQDERERGRKAAKDGHPVTEPLVMHRRIAAIRSRVDADGAGRHLADGHDVGEL